MDEKGGAIMLEELAFEIAKAAHAGQTDKAGLDYILHPLQVAAEVTTDEEKAGEDHPKRQGAGREIPQGNRIFIGLNCWYYIFFDFLNRKCQVNPIRWAKYTIISTMRNNALSVSAKGIAKTKSIITNIRTIPGFVMFFFINGSSMYCLYFSDSTNCLCKRSELWTQKKPVSR